MLDFDVEKSSMFQNTLKVSRQLMNSENVCKQDKRVNIREFKTDRWLKGTSGKLKENQIDG